MTTSFRTALYLCLSCVAACTPREHEPPKPGAVPTATAEEEGKASPSGHETIFYPSGSLKIEAYLYKPAGDGPFPAIVYNHGSRGKAERKEVPFRYVAEMLKDHGYLVLVPERRGYGKSGGTPFSEAEAGGEGLVPRMREEAEDVIAAREYLASLPAVQKNNIGVMGWSLGGIVTVLALSKSHGFRAGVNQAGGSLSWKRTPPLREAMEAAAATIDAPLLSLDAQNDATTESVEAVDAAMGKHGGVHKVVIYPPFTPAHLTDSEKHAPGHQIFGPGGMPIWKDEVLAWLDQHVKGAGKAPEAAGAPASGPVRATDGTFTVGGLRYRELVTAGAREDDKLPMVVMFHGRGGRPAMFEHMRESLTAKARLILPFGGLPYKEGFAWFDLEEGEPGPQLAVILPKLAAQVASALEQIHTQRPSTGKIVVGGFSQGANVSYALALLHPALLARACPASGRLPSELLRGPAPPAPRPEVHGFHGDEDKRMPTADGKATIAGLKALGYVADMKLFPGVTHEFGPQAADVRACVEAGVRAALASP